MVDCMPRSLPNQFPSGLFVWTPDHSGLLIVIPIAREGLFRVPGVISYSAAMNSFRSAEARQFESRWS